MRIINNISLPTGLFIFCVVIFSASLDYDFVMDDWPVIKENSKITDTKYIPDYFTQGIWSNTDLAKEVGVTDHSLYRPVFLLTLNIGYQLWGDSALGYHALNLVLHGINTVLVYFLILGFLSPAHRIAAGISAAIFAAHPIHVESVTWIAGMTDPLVSIFLLCGFLLHRRTHQTTSQKLLCTVGAPVFFALALLSKETAIFFPLILIIYDALFQRPALTSKSNIIHYVIYAVILLIYFILRSSALSTDEALQSTVWDRINLQNFPVLLAFLTHYIQLLIFPSPLEYYYSPPATSLFIFAIGGTILVGAFLYLPRALRKKQHLYTLATAWIIITLLPALAIALFDEPVFAQRVLYLPSVGFSILIAWCLQQTNQLSRPIKMTTIIGFLTVFVFFSIATILEIADWENDTVFYTQAIKSNPNSFKPVAGLATTYERETNQNYGKAIELYLKAHQLATAESDKFDFLESAARIYGQTGNTKKSEELYTEIVERMPKRSSAWVGLGNNALARRAPQQALPFYQKAYDADPKNRIASYNLSLVYQQLGNFERAAFFQRIAQSP